MPPTQQIESTLTDRYQTTVPETVRRALRLGKRDKIHYTIRPDGEVVLTRATAARRRRRFRAAHPGAGRRCRGRSGRSAVGGQ